MRGWNLFRALLGLWIPLVMAGVACGQTSSGFSGDSLPPRPGGHVTDNAGLYVHSPGALEKIEARLRQLEEKEGFHIYVITESVLLGATPVDFASRLEKAWIPEGDGFVVVFEVDSRAFGIGRPYELSFTGETPAGPQMPTIAAGQTIERVRKQLMADQKERPMDSPALLERLTSLLADECTRYFEVARSSDKNSHLVKLAVIFAGVIVAIAAAGYLVHRLAGKNEARKNRSYRFPPVTDQQRLGAPFGAKVAARRFRGGEP